MQWICCRYLDSLRALGEVMMDSMESFLSVSFLCFLFLIVRHLDKLAAAFRFLIFTRWPCCICSFPMKRIGYNAGVRDHWFAYNGWYRHGRTQLQHVLWVVLVSIPGINSPALSHAQRRQPTCIYIDNLNMPSSCCEVDVSICLRNYCICRSWRWRIGRRSCSVPSKPAACYPCSCFLLSGCWLESLCSWVCFWLSSLRCVSYQSLSVVPGGTLARSESMNLYRPLKLLTSDRCAWLTLTLAWTTCQCCKANFTIQWGISCFFNSCMLLFRSGCREVERNGPPSRAARKRCARLHNPRFIEHTLISPTYMLCTGQWLATVRKV